MEPKDRIIVALDVDYLDKAKELVEALAPHVGMFKVGLELLMSDFPRRIVNAMDDAHARVFFDGKFMDIPNTVAGAVRAVTRMGVHMLNVHCLGGSAMMHAAREAAVESARSDIGLAPPLVLGVTILTSLDGKELQTLGIVQPPTESERGAAAVEMVDIAQERLEDLVATLARLAVACGLDGVIASPREVRMLRSCVPESFLIVTPGVRPEWAAAQDQKRVMTPAEAIEAGANYLVIGRPITRPPAEIGTPVDAARRIAEEIAAVEKD